MRQVGGRRRASSDTFEPEPLPTSSRKTRNSPDQHSLLRLRLPLAERLYADMLINVLLLAVTLAGSGGQWVPRQRTSLLFPGSPGKPQTHMNSSGCLLANAVAMKSIFDNVIKSALRTPV